MTSVKFLKVSAVIVFAIAWVFSGWPSVWQNPSFPPEIRTVSADTTNTNYAGTAADGQTGEKCAWSNPGNATGDTTGSAATCDLGGNNSFTNWLQIKNFGFTSSDIPSGSTIDGVTVEVEWDAGTSINDTSVYLSTDGLSTTGNNKGTDTSNNSKSFQTYGGSADTWGVSLTQADVTSNNFGVLLQYQKNSGGPSVLTNVYRVRMTINYTPVSSFEQSGYRFFANQDSTDVGSTLATENTAVTLTSAGQNFRLRNLLHVSNAELAQSGQDFKLQFADKGGGTCASPGGSYTDVTTGTAIAFNDNATPADGDPLTDNANDPTHSGHTINNQTYEEANNFTNSQSAIAAGEDGLWDFSLTDNGAPEGTTYCLRAVESDGTALSAYSQYPEVTTHTPAQPVFSAEDFRFFSNQDSTDVGSALATENTAVTLTSAGENFRLRSLLHVSNAELSQSGQDFALEYADQTGYGSCSVIPDENYDAVTVSSSGTAGSDWEEATSSAAWPSRSRHTSVVYDNKIWVMGGYGSPTFNDVWYYASSTDSWTEATSSAAWSERSSHASVVYDNKMWVMGGNDGDNLNDVWYSSDGVNWTEATASSSWAGRQEHAAVTYDGRIWVMGGHTIGTEYNDVWYSTDGINWTEATASAPWSPRYNHTSVVYDNKMWVIGGDDDSTNLNDVWYYASSTDSWTEATSSAPWSERNTHTSVVYDNKMWVIGGEVGSLNFLSDVWYSTDGINWTEATSSAPWPVRSRHTSVAYDGKFWVLGGLNESGNSFDDVWHSPLSVSPISFNDNATPADGAALTDNANDPTHSGHTINNQTYEEANNFTNSQSAISAGEDGLWDFSLTDNNAPEGTTYCLRPTEADGTTFDTYNQYPSVTTFTTPTPVFSAEDFRFFSNQDSTDVGSALASENTGVTLTSAGENFRLRQLLHVSDAELAQSGQDFQLQYADQTGYGSCSVIPDGDYEAVTDSTGSGGTAGADWEEATSSASWVEREGHTSVVYDNKMWVLGGYGGNNYLNDVWHSTNGANWTEATSSAAWSVRRYHTSVVYDGKIWVLGGHDGNGRLNDVWYYASSTDSWTEATSSAAWVARNNHTSVVYDNKMWVIAGHDGTNYRNDVWYSTDGVNWTEATTSAAWAERDHHTSVAYDNKMWVLGGFQFVDTSTNYNDVWYSTDGANWTEATSSAGWSERNSHASVVYDNKMWVMGSGTKNDVWHSSDGVNWTEATSSAAWSARQSHTSVAYDNKMWLMGGTSGGEINDVWHSPLSGSTIAFNDNTTPNDGSALTDNANDPTHNSDTINNQTYEEANNFTNSQSAIAAGEDGLWDFSLTVDSEAPTSTTYCLRPTEADGTTFDTYNQYPSVTTYNGTAAVSVTVSDGTISYGTLSGDTASSTVGSDTQTASNDGSVTIDLNIQGQDTSCPWTLAGTTGIDQYMHEFSTNSGSSWTALTTTYQTLATGIASSGTQDFDLQVTTPTDSSCDTMQSVDVVVQAVEQ